MKTPVLLAVDGPAEAYAALFAAAKASGVRIGWLVMDVPVDPPPPLRAPPLLGAFRAVAVGDGRSLAMKPMKGKAVLRDLLREHFLGADVVLVAGLPLFPRLAAREGGWHLSESATAGRLYTTEALLVRLRKPALRWKRD
jgi:hypothetical protein